MGNLLDSCIESKRKIAKQYSAQIPIRVNANVNAHWKSSTGRIITKIAVRPFEAIPVHVSGAIANPVH